MTKGRKKTWADLDHETRLERIRTLWNEGKSDKQIGDALSATKGQIVGYRHTHLPDVTAATRGTKSAAAPVKTVPSRPAPAQKPAAQLPRIEAAQPKPEPQKAAPAPPRVQESVMKQTLAHIRPADPPAPEHKKLKVAASHRSQCDHEFPDDRRQCAFEATVKKNNGQYCENHAHLH